MIFRKILINSAEAIVENKLRSALTMLGMIIGVMAVILLVSVGTGAKRYITSEFESLGTNVILVQPGKTDKKNSMGPPVSSSKGKLTMGDVEALQKNTTSLAAISGVMFGAGVVKNEFSTNNLNILGCNDEFNRIFNMVISQGNFFSKEDEDSGRRVVILGHTIKQNLFGSGNALGQLVKVNDSEHRVIGIVRPTGDKLGFNVDDMVFIPTKSALRLFNTTNLFGIRASAKSRSSLDVAVKDMTDILKERHNGEEDFTIITQVTMMESMNTILNMLTYALGAIAFISMLVGGIGIMNIMLVSVTERTREIGIRRAVGARRSDILKQFMVEAVTISVSGGLLGILASLLVTNILFIFLPGFDMRPPFWIIPPSFFMSLFTGVAFGVWPAKKAAHIQTIDALRYE
ncbi:MAG: ABC transporter permease [Bacteriovorax sp.]|jgi:putative ABC transport system permease protein